MTATPYPLRPVTEPEFAPWMRMIVDTYGQDRSDDLLAIQRAGTDLDRTVAAFDGDRPVGGASIYPRVLTVPGARVPVAGIASVGVTPTHRRRGINTSLMRRQLTDLHDTGAEPVAALRPAEAGIYGRYGYGPASYGAQLRVDRRALVFRPGTDFGDGTMSLLDAATARPVLADCYRRVAAVTVGWPDRDAAAWDFRLYDPPRPDQGLLRYALHTEPDGRVSGYVLYRRGAVPGLVRVEELVARTRTGYAALWRFMAGIDLVETIEYEAAVDDALPHLLLDPRAAAAGVEDRLWVRLVDVDRALAARRYGAPLDLVLDVTDEFCDWNTGRYRLSADADAVGCERTTAAADLRLSATELGAMFLGGTTAASLAAAGRVVELRPGALARCDAAFRSGREPFYPGGWAFPLY